MGRNYEFCLGHVEFEASKASRRRKQLNIGAWSSQRRWVKTYRYGKHLPRSVTDTTQSMGKVEGCYLKRREMTPEEC